MARKADPTRARRGTGNRPNAGEPPVISDQDAAIIALRNPSAPDRSGLPAPPSDLPEGCTEMWYRAVEELNPRGLREADLSAIEMMCIAYHRHKQARAIVERNGMVVTGRNGPVINPMIKVEREQAQAYLKIADEYGLTFASRLRLGLIQLTGQSILQSLDDDLGKTWDA